MKILCYNNNPFMNKAFRKTIMAISRLKNKFNKISSAKTETAIKSKEISA